MCYANEVRRMQSSRQSRLAAGTSIPDHPTLRTSALASHQLLGTGFARTLHAVID